MVNIAKLRLALGQTTEATQTALDALALDNQLGGAHAVLAVAAANTQHYEDVIEYAAAALMLGERDPLLAFCMADALMRQRRYEEALEPAHAAAMNHSSCPHAPALYVRVLHYLGRFEEAGAYAESLGEEALILPKLQSALTTLYMDAEQMEKAEAAAAAALASNPADAEAGTVAAFLSLAALDSGSAAERFTQVLTTSPGFGRAQLGLGLAYMLSEDLNRAIDTLKQTTVSLEGHLGSWQALAWCQILAKDPSMARATLMQAMELDHNFAETHGALAVTALMQGDLAAAQEYSQRAMRLDRDNFSGSFALSLIKQLSGNSTEAQTIMERLLSEPVLPDGKTIQQALAVHLIKNTNPSVY